MSVARVFPLMPVAAGVVLAAVVVGAAVALRRKAATASARTASAAAVIPLPSERERPTGTDPS